MGYDSFGSFDANPAWLVAQKLNSTKIENVELSGVPLPADFYKAPKVIEKLLLQHEPDIVIGMGVYPKEDAIRVEKVGINLMDYRWIDALGSPPEEVPDCSGNKPEQEPIITGGPVAYFASLPVEEIVQRIRAEGIPAHSSFTAGTHCCNLCLYTTLHTIAIQKLRTLGGYIHLPLLPSQAMTMHNMPSLPLDVMVRAVKIAVEKTVDKLNGKS